MNKLTYIILKIIIIVIILRLIKFVDISEYIKYNVQFSIIL